MFQIKNRKVLVLQAEAKINEFRLRKRYLTLLVFFGLCFSVLMCRLFVLQVLMHSEYSEKAKDNIESETTLKAGRGVIYDRKYGAADIKHYNIQDICFSERCSG